MDNRAHEEWKELLESELKSIRKKGSVSKEDLPLVKAAFSALDHMENYCKNCNDNRYSEGHMMYGVNTSTGQMYSENASYGPNRSPVTGRYIQSNGASYGPDYNRYSGHSIKDRMVAKMEQLYDEAHSEHERQLITNEINRLRTEM